MSRLHEATARRSRPRHDGKTPEVASTSGVLFPLPLTPLELLFLQDESPAYPMQFFYRLRFQGRFRRPWLDEALRIAQSRQPLLTAVVDDEDERDPHWRACLQPLPPAEWLEAEPATSFPPARFLDVRARPGLHVTAVVGAQCSDIVLQVHHAASDGLGALDFATDLLTAYANLAHGTNRYRLKPLDVNRLRDRGALGLTGWPLFRWGMRRLSVGRALWRFFRRRPAPLVPHRPWLDDPAPPPAYPEACVHHLSRAETAALAARAHGNEATINALLVRDLFLAMAQWRRHYPPLPPLGKGGSGGVDAWLRLMVPVSRRSPADRRLPAANLASMFFLDHCLAEQTDPEVLLGDVSRALRDLRSHDLGLGWLLALRVLRHLPGPWANARRSRRRCLFSALLTNLGPVFAGSPLPRDDRRLVVGDMILEEVEFISLARSLQCLGLAVSTYAGRMTLGMRYDSRVLTAAQAQDLMDLYVAQLRGGKFSTCRRLAS